MSQKNQWIGLNDRSQEGVMIWDSDGSKVIIHCRIVLVKKR